ncbi:MAG: phycobiliprotein lyase [Cyanobacteriota bacterium]|nr:phycobiliprotein lyase [Cyanobacteriota bacterium]
MEIVNFFETLAGKWFSQRTTHYLGDQSSQAGQSNLLIEFLGPEDARLISLCQPLGHGADQVLCGLQIDQDSRPVETGPPVKTSSLMVVLAARGDAPGLVLQRHGDQAVTTGHYHLEEEILTLTTATDTGTLEERLWFANPNLRMRTSVVTISAGVALASFCSEIRMGLAR